MGVSKQMDSAIGMGLATTFVITLATGACWMLEHWVLVPFDIVPAHPDLHSGDRGDGAVLEMVVKKSAPGLYQTLGIYLPLITTNCAVLGLPLLNAQERNPFVLPSHAFGFGSSLGFTQVLAMFAGIRERVALAQVPAALRRARPSPSSPPACWRWRFMGFSGLPNQMGGLPCSPQFSV